MVEEHEALLDRLRAENSEEYNQLKITLETDLQVNCLTLITGQSFFKKNKKYILCVCVYKYICWCVCINSTCSKTWRKERLSTRVIKRNLSMIYRK